ncbi:hypothetical protein GS610_17935 [Ruegeria sp. HKCCD6228]|uniref:CopG-like ribbon-helix-helix domain-containing protein n=1 Tax=Ruegeria atlantica TaxID=81569 RepID=A0ABX1W4U7_9RHOB|nr:MULTISPECIES: hypothetical protein [Ruegeria]NOC85387.1 hypothetical protein [Ruegeria sp. HKCCD6428]NOC94561.1 hypothetical protein [Ruegeria sp. HKCCD6604]NOD28936.1 hypothetical protein [Ruegeria atlantica]NOD99086.1 hypothetical protein [Ruegeria sp. HKCCD6228]
MPDDTARTERVVTLLTKSEKELLRSQAEDSELSLSTFCHHLILEGLKTSKS